MKKKSKNRRKVAEKPLTILSNEYLKNKTDPFVIFILKLIFVYILALGIVFTIVDFYHIPYVAVNIIQQTVLIVTAFFPVYTLFKKRYVSGIFGAIAAVILFFTRDTVITSFSVFWDMLLLKLDSRLLDTAQFVKPTSIAYDTNTATYSFYINVVLLILIIFISLICVFCCYKKFRPTPLLISVGILIIPSFFSETADFYWGILPLIVGFVGMYTISSSKGFYYYYISDSYKQAKALSAKEEKDFESSSQKMPLIDRTISKLKRYGKHNNIAITAMAFTLIGALSFSIIIPNGKYIDYETIINKIGETVTDIGNKISSAFNFEVPNIFNSYFTVNNGNSTDNTIINLDAPSNSEKEVLKVKLEKTDAPIYLRGDIGVSYTGSGWESIQAYDDLTFKYKFPDGQSTNAIKYSSIFNEFYPEYAFQFFYNSTRFVGPIAYQKVKIEYLTNTQVVFLPTHSSAPNYKSDQDLKWFGDVVLRIADQNKYLKNYEAYTYYPIMDNISSELLNSYIFNGSDYQEFLVNRLSTDKLPKLPYYHYAYDYKNPEYSDDAFFAIINELNQYSVFVEMNYTSSYSGEQENIEAFLQQVFSDSNLIENYNHYFKYYDNLNYNTYVGDYFGKYNKVDLGKKYTIANEICEYLKNNYEYSLTANNNSNDNTVIGNFLHKTKQGHCALYATSMVLALRELGIPSRYVTGFVADGNYTEVNGQYETILREKNMHAWVEVYFENIGWLPFDPTGGSNGNGGTGEPAFQTTPVQTTVSTTTTADDSGQSETSPTSPTTTTGEATNVTTQVTTENDESKNNGLSPVVYIITSIVLLAVLILLTIIYLIKHGKKLERKRFEFYKNGNTNEAVKSMYAFTLWLLSLAEIKIQNSETPMEFAYRIDKRMYRLKDNNNLTSAMAVFEQMEFSKNNISQSDRTIAYNYVEFLYNETVLRSGKLKIAYYRLKLN